MWSRAVVVRIRARRVFVLGTAVAGLLLVALPRALALDPDRRISQYAHTAWRVRDDGDGCERNQFSTLAKRAVQFINVLKSSIAKRWKAGQVILAVRRFDSMLGSSSIGCGSRDAEGIFG
jgi:hypothetical protein